MVTSIDVRDAFVAASTATVDLIGRREMGDRWTDRSVLDGFDIGTLAAHLARAVLTVYWYLDMPEPPGEPVTAGGYYAPHPTNPLDAANAAVVARSAETAKAGWARLYLDVAKAAERVAERLADEPESHLIPANGRALLVDEYLRTRLVELVVHLDDLSRSLGVPPPTLPAVATRIATEVLVEAATVRHGGRAVLMALAGREPDITGILRVL